MLDLIQKLINEHGSSSILAERLRLIQDQYSALERRCSDLEAENTAHKSEIHELRRKAKSPLQINGRDVYCSHCGSANVQRSGSRRDPIFGDLGVDRIIFTCNDCKQTSDFLND